MGRVPERRLPDTLGRYELLRLSQTVWFWFLGFSGFACGVAP
jgi:hypothetical protein